jgi:CheY-like chemotaxis protein
MGFSGILAARACRAIAGCEPVAQSRAEAKILVVDDDPITLALTSAALRQAGFEVFAAVDAHAAFVLLEQKPDIDLMITDVVMPGLDGLMLADMVKLRHPEVRVIYMTGFPDHTARQPGRRYGPTLPKPIETTTLAAAARRTLSEPSDRFGFRPDTSSSSSPACGQC